MVTVGLDPHPASHTVVALDPIGASLGSLTVPNTDAGLEERHRFASQFATRQWAMEGAGDHFISPFVMQGLANGELVYPIAPSVTSQYRCRGRKKNDEVDAGNVARALLANPQLPPLHFSSRQREWQELSQAQKRLSEQLKANRSALGELAEHSPVRAVLDEVIRTLTSQLSELERQLRRIVRERMPCLRELPGVGAVVGGTLVGRSR